MPAQINMIFHFFNINKKASHLVDPFIFLYCLHCLDNVLKYFVIVLDLCWQMPELIKNVSFNVKLRQGLACKYGRVGRIKSE